LTTRHSFVGVCGSSCILQLRLGYLTRNNHEIYDMIYLITASGSSPGGSSTVHIYTQTIHRTTQSTQTVHRTTQLIGKNAGRAPSLRVIPWHLP